MVEPLDNSTVFGNCLPVKKLNPVDGFGAHYLPQ
jgi:hypothetical protein